MYDTFGGVFVNNIKEIINIIYRKSASLNLYTSICNAKKERLLKELADIKSDIETAEKNLKQL